MGDSLKQLKLLPRENLVRTSPVDHADWNYNLFLRGIQRLRFHLALELLETRHYPKLLEIGYGSGVFLPALAECCDDLYATDLHGESKLVAEQLIEHGVTAQLSISSATSLPYEDNQFNAVVSISTLEYIDDINAAYAEISRILQPDGVLVVVTPRQSQLLDFGLRFLAGENPNENYRDRRAYLMNATERHFTIERTAANPWPWYPLKPYAAMRLIKNSAHE